MNKAQAMLADQRRGLRPPSNEPRKPPPPPPGPLFRWVRQGTRPGTWRPWWLLGLVEVVTYPLPRFSAPALYVPGLRASCGLPARPALLVEL